LKARLQLAALVLASAALVSWFFYKLPVGRADLAIDWKVFWSATRGFAIHYLGNLVFSPPWTLALLWPLTALPLRLSWGFAAYGTLAALLACMPRSSSRWRNLAAALLLCTSYPAVRQLVDGNLEAFVFGGVLLLVWAAGRRSAAGFALGALLASSKIQASWLLLLFASWWIYTNWLRREFWKAAIYIALPVLITIVWRGGDWLEALARFPFRGTALDASLFATGSRLSLPGAITGIIWLLVLAGSIWALRDRRMPGRAQASLLVSAGLLLAPYAASNSVLTPLALGVPLLFPRRPWVGLSLFVLANAPFVFLNDVSWRTNYEASYWTLVLIVFWIVFLVDLRLQRDHHPARVEN
jgi:hypothetical protein